jgi:hypothetical protein
MFVKVYKKSSVGIYLDTGREISVIYGILLTVIALNMIYLKVAEVKRVHKVCLHQF